VTRPHDDATPTWPIDSADADAAELHEAWTALGQALGPSAQSPLDEVTTARIVRHVLRREERRRRRRWGVAALCAAAAVLLLLGKPQFPQPSSQQIAQQVEPSTANAEAVVAVAAQNSTWNDPFDRELAEMREQVQAVELDWSRSDDSFAYFGERLQALEAEWKENPL
jgi:hypothetical protein